MNTPRIPLLTLLAVSSLFASLVRADEASYAKVLKERETVLSQILAAREVHYTTGGLDEEAVSSARLALWSFRRDIAPSTAEKIKQQELIVAVYEKKLVTLKTRSATGLVGREDVLLATDSLLQAQQTLEELKLKEKKG
jgi:hypothetical protein